MRIRLLIALPLLLSGCSAQGLYQIGQGWQRQECQRLQAPDERARCEKSTATSYEGYRAEAGAASKPRP
jgi:hypothetical protein